MKARASIEKGFFLLASLILSGALWRLFSTGGPSSTDGDPRTQVLLAIVYSVVAILAAFRFRDAARSLLRNPALACLLLLACASALWAESPDLVFRRALGLVGASLFGIVFASYYPFEKQLGILRWAFRIGATATLLLFVVSPSRALSAPGGGGAYRGIFPHKNILGATMALAFLVEWYLRERQGWAKILRLLSFCAYGALLIASNSMTSIVTVVAALGAVWTFRSLHTRFQIPAWALGLYLTAGIGAAALTGIGAADVVGLLGRSSDLTGRTELWSAVFESILEKPLLGFGFSGYWKGASSSSDNVQGQIGWAPTYSHDGYLEIMLSLGLVGLLLVICILVTLFKRSWRRSEEGDSPLDSWPLAVFFFVAIHNVTECTIAWQNCLEWSVCVAAVIGCDPRWRAVLEDDEVADETVDDHASLPEPECV
jgi:exopolysaccharide production protein ExoQ